MSGPADKRTGGPSHKRGITPSLPMPVRPSAGPLVRLVKRHPQPETDHPLVVRVIALALEVERRRD